eukprot:Nk52_evm27s248 gene=Nk52_evmTU27s248
MSASAKRAAPASSSAEHTEKKSKGSGGESHSEQATSTGDGYWGCYVYEVRGNWALCCDYTTQRYYYQNYATMTTQWETPEEWNTLQPSAEGEGEEKKGISGGRGGEEEEEEEEGGVEFDPAAYAADYEQICAGTYADQNEKSNAEATVSYQPPISRKEVLSRPARKQVNEGTRKKVHEHQQGQNEYNIWYDRYSGDHWKGGSRGPAETRCDVVRDSGWTKADKLAGTTVENSAETNHFYFCIHFAKGCCHLGSKCNYYHRVPDDIDEECNANDYSHDCFGRDMAAQQRDDRGGVGSFFDKSGGKTLYIGRLGTGHARPLEEVLADEFGEYGEIEHMNVVSRKNIAFVRFKNRMNAEFAKIAMADQPLEGLEPINVRWANVDPNPKAQAAFVQDTRKQVIKSALKRGYIEKDALETEGPHFLPK